MIIGIIKPKGPTSHDIIYQVRRVTGVKRVGHAGTLDPAASGVLVVAIGREFTKQLGEIVKHNKEYLAEVTLGATSSTDDGEGIIVPSESCMVPSEKELKKVIDHFVGRIEQVPPAFSAIKMAGKKAYELARKGVDVAMKPREVDVHYIELLSYSWPKLVIKVGCGKGVYIRSLARDIGKALGVGGYMSALERTRVGDYTLENSLTIEQLKQLWVEKAGKS